MKIGIELNGVVRDINRQCLKYYAKDIDPNIDESDVDMNSMSIMPKLDFKSNYERKKFVYEDYPYELFACANTMSRNLHVFLNGWAYDLYWNRDKSEVSLFSLDEEELSIQSTYFFLSKGSRIRRMFFPMNSKEVWKLFDVVITQDKDVVINKPDGKIAVLIRKSDNAEASDKADFKYDNLEDVIKDSEFLGNVEKMLEECNNKSLLSKIRSKISRCFKLLGK